MTMTQSYITKVYETLTVKYPHEKEYLQAVKEFFHAIAPVVEAHPEYEQLAILERIVEPERIISFRVPWVDDQGQVQVNRGYRVQFSSLNGPYKGGLRFHPTVNQSILKFLGFEQIFKNMLTGLPIGGGKGGADFDPKGKSDVEVMRFCQSFMTELSKHVGPDVDVPAGDIGVGGREIGYLLGQYKRLQGPMAGVLTGKPVAANGSRGRTEATGYGLVYFLNEMLKEAGQTMTGKKVMISGSGNVAFFAAKKVTELGGIVVTMSDSNHAIFNPNGINLDAIEELKVNGRERISRYQEFDAEAEIVEGSVWDLDVKADIALPCATQNEINQAQAERLVKNAIKMVAEGANMPSDSDAIEVYRENQIHYGPGKAANAGGVAVSALEMSQNSMRLKWTSERVDQELQQIMKNIFAQCVKARDTYDLGVDYGAAADIASFEQVAELMMIHGVI
ncbi:NADP-specific glutamate dehydrogenase [Globicatella sp. PHS-GS-PNBC-21-1553]|uniref:NADP-specific glutamate dehydrogenase n=1 Tax=Globicatella sp. PHS-GS-PNBC-21-1553 TaxID=2885764 RepID=UPI00298EE473|nr:NADP-specific glutamate dehydrogenase [Globicatella sp. PHS-GS-PNBC-21-1553]WPC08894.1 NADP-specific glutamate dehydrogenase [Globicatella sp. PHS-GS-PNBC-21-1553]